MKKVVFLIITIILLRSLYGIYLFLENRQFGRELVHGVNTVLYQSGLLADGISYLEKEFANPDWRNKGITSHLFDVAILEVHTHFGGDMPLLEDVRYEWYARFEELWNQVIGKDMDQLEKVFLAEADEISHLRIQLENMTKYLRGFVERYDQMSEWERYFVSWKNEQKILSEKVRFR